MSEETELARLKAAELQEKQIKSLTRRLKECDKPKQAIMGFMADRWEGQPDTSWWGQIIEYAKSLKAQLTEANKWEDHDITKLLAAEARAVKAEGVVKALADEIESAEHESDCKENGCGEVKCSDKNCFPCTCFIGRARAILKGDS